jgi:hypothetical protein
MGKATRSRRQGVSLDDIRIYLTAQARTSWSSCSCRRPRWMSACVSTSS